MKYLKMISVISQIWSQKIIFTFNFYIHMHVAMESPLDPILGNNFLFFPFSS